MANGQLSNICCLESDSMCACFYLYFKLELTGLRYSRFSHAYLPGGSSCCHLGSAMSLQ